MQTGASALLAAASIASLYGVVRFFDLFRRYPAVEAEPQRIEFDASVEMEPAPAPQIYRAPPVSHEPQLKIVGIAEDLPVEEAQPVGIAEDVPGEEAQPVCIVEQTEEAAAPAKASRRARAPRKTSGRAAKAPKETRVAQPEPAAEAEFEVPAIAEQPTAVEPEPFEEPFHSPVAPLFEPEPYVRQQQRAVFGRKAG